MLESDLLLTRLRAGFRALKAESKLDPLALEAQSSFSPASCPMRGLRHRSILYYLLLLRASNSM